MIEERRETNETTIRIVVACGTGTAKIKTGEPFLDHMMTALARYAALDTSK